jgi:hypothetical protein
MQRGPEQKNFQQQENVKRLTENTDRQAMRMIGYEVIMKSFSVCSR